MADIKSPGTDGAAVHADAQAEAASDVAAVPADLQDERLLNQQGFGPVVRGFVNRLRGGDLGSLPVVVGLIVICVVFYSLQPRFLSSVSLVNLLQFAAPIGMISLGIVLVLLLGEIDLSVGSVAGFASASMAVLLVNKGQSLVVAMLVAVLIGVVIGSFYALLYTKVGVPSFVFSLAGLLAFQGGLLYVLGSQGTINLPVGSGLAEFARFKYVEGPLAYVLVLIVVAAYFGSQVVGARRRAAAGLSTPWWPLVIAKAVALGAGLLYLTYYLSLGPARGWGYLFLLFALMCILLDLALRKTTWGRHVFAVGGNVEAARRSGIKVNRIYFSVFALCSTFAAFGGLMLVGQLNSVSQATGTGDTNLTAIAAAVIGGTSLFGGRGSAYAAMLGIIVLQAIQSGLNIINVDSSVRFMVTGAVLLLAVAIDSVSRRARASSGRG